jgi:hypothetical protein
MVKPVEPTALEKLLAALQAATAERRANLGTAFASSSFVRGFLQQWAQGTSQADWRDKSPSEQWRCNMMRLIVAGMVGVGLGIMTWVYLGEDVKRYIRIRNM